MEKQKINDKITKDVGKNYFAFFFYKKTVVEKNANRKQYIFQASKSIIHM